jgi:hypothetical protein
VLGLDRSRPPAFSAAFAGWGMVSRIRVVGVTRLLLVLFYLEVGFALIVVPWSAFWDRNYFAQALPSVHTFITNNFVRGAVSGIGIVNIFVGISELVSMMLARRQDPHVTLRPSPASEEQ